MDETRLWRQCAALAMGVLRWPPDVFWNATPAELYLALEGMTGRTLDGTDPAPLSRAELEALSSLFPDQPMRDR
jgi:uncharacterized phage protein (TIGR02216 family)